MNYRSKTEVAYTILKEKILQGTLAPGTRLVIDELARTLSVSHIPVREAMQQLSAEGFIVTKPYLGSYVSEIHSESVKEIFELIQALELISVRSAALCVTTRDIAEFTKQLEHMDTLLGDPESWSQANISLHLWFCQKGKVPLVEDALSRAFVHWDRLRRVYFASVSAKHITRAQREHWLMHDALSAQDTAELEAVVRQHNASATAAYLAHIDSVLNCD